MVGFDAAALFYGLVTSLSAQDIDLRARLPFAQVRDNFHRTARWGLGAHIAWLDGARLIFARCCGMNYFRWRGADWLP